MHLSDFRGTYFRVFAKNRENKFRENVQSQSSRETGSAKLQKIILAAKINFAKLQELGHLQK